MGRGEPGPQLLGNHLPDGGGTLVGLGGALQSEGRDVALVLRGPGCDEKTHIASSYLGEAGQTVPPGCQGHEVTGPGLTRQDRTARQGRAPHVSQTPSGACSPELTGIECTSSFCPSRPRGRAGQGCFCCEGPWVGVGVGLGSPLSPAGCSRLLTTLRPPAAAQHSLPPPATLPTPPRRLAILFSSLNRQHMPTGQASARPGDTVRTHSLPFRSSQPCTENTAPTAES